MTSNLCYGDSKDLETFMKEVMSYGFKDRPNYDYLRSLLKNDLKMSLSQCASTNYDSAEERSDTNIFEEFVKKMKRRFSN